MKITEARHINMVTAFRIVGAYRMKEMWCISRWWGVLHTPHYGVMWRICIFDLLKGLLYGEMTPIYLGGVSWQYRVIHLWNTKARELLDTQNPALVALVGSAELEEPEKELTEAIDYSSKKSR